MEDRCLLYKGGLGNQAVQSKVMAVAFYFATDQEGGMRVTTVVFLIAAESYAGCRKCYSSIAHPIYSAATSIYTRTAYMHKHIQRSEQLALISAAVSQLISFAIVWSSPPFHILGSSFFFF